MVSEPIIYFAALQSYCARRYQADRKYLTVIGGAETLFMDPSKRSGIAAMAVDRQGRMGLGATRNLVSWNLGCPNWNCSYAVPIFRLRGTAIVIVIKTKRE
jgi:hypothetical protein